ncbi:hypothetical protein [Paracraurococcus lichenis]|uniref:Uncharacterized protein n=1 Tax=Paracraurococcus lichenis TaxID=3064888 RepID=A0ABT9E879_9PROT|nr:hypothetical protein [Paracraurococcus sp. LOR1-02]MDO9712412.1 hypothetical protein [Paracraurococcus sp. LOR1-02]
MATMHPDDFLPRPRPAPPRPGRAPEAARQVLDALAALSERAEAAGLDATAARLRAIGKLACAEVVAVRLAGLV